MAAPTFSGVSAYGSYATAGGSAGVSVTPAVTTTAGRGVLLIMTGQDSSSVNSVTDSKGNTWTQIGTFGTFTQYATPIWFAAYYCPALVGAGSGHTFTVNTTGAPDGFATIMMAEFNGPVTFGNLTNTTDSSVPWGASITTSAADQLVVAGMNPATGGGTTWTLTSTGYSFLRGGNAATDWVLGMLYKQQPTSGTVENLSITGSDTVNGEAAYIRLMTFTGTGGGGGTSLTPGAGAVTLTGYTPTVARTANQALSPAQKAIAITGPVPTVARTANVALVPGQKAIVLTGFAPTVTQATGVNLSPSAAALSITGPAPVVAQTAHVALSPLVAALAITGYPPTVVNSGVIPTGPTNENDIHGGKKRREVYWRPLLQRMVDARQEDRPAPPKGRAKVRAKAIEQDAVRLVMDGGGTLAEFNQLLERWTAQHEVEEIQMDPLGAFVAAMRMRVEQAGEIERLAALARQAARQRDDEEAAILLLLA